MTKEQTIKHLKLMQSGARNAIRYSKNDKEISEEERKEDIEIYQDQLEALDIAIKALEQQPCETAIDKKEVFNILRRNYRGQSVSVDGYCVPANYREDIYDEIKALPPVTPTQRWIPVSERLPKNRDWYLGIFREHDTGWINRLPFVCDYVGKETKATTKEFWILHGFTDIDNPCDYYKNLECVAWKPLPKP